MLVLKFLRALPEVPKIIDNDSNEHSMLVMQWMYGMNEMMEEIDDDGGHEH